MYVTRLLLKNWRNFTDLDLRLREQVYVVGPNAAGKSNLLDALRFLRVLTLRNGGLQEAIAQRGGFSKLRSLFARREPRVTISVEVGEIGAQPQWVYELGITQETHGKRRPIISTERVVLPNGDVVARPNSADENDPERLTQTLLEQTFANKDMRPLVDFFAEFSYLHLVPQLIRNPEAFAKAEIPEDPYGNHFLERVAELSSKSRDARLRWIEAALAKAVPNLKELKFHKDPSTGRPHLQGRYEHWRPNAGIQSEVDFSDGTLRLIAMLWQMLDGDGVLLLEEPEISLHPAIVRELPRAFRAMYKRRHRQVIVSSHSDDLLDDTAISADQVVLLRPGKEGTSAITADADPELRILMEQGLSAAQAVLPRSAPAHADEFGRQLTIW